MGDIKGFLKVRRRPAQHRPVYERIKDYAETCVLPGENHLQEQSSRCMDCDTPFCHSGCPLGNYIPEWNDLIFRGRFKEALQLLEASNNLPEITGRLCPALCEYACVLGINDDPVTIRENELALIEYGFNSGLIKPQPPKKRTGKKIAVIGSGPAGLSCADQLNQSGHSVTVFERDAQIGGLLRYGIPDFKLEKQILERRIKLLKKEGIKFKTNANAGVDLSAQKLLREFDAICLACGSRAPRDLKIEGRELKGIYFALDYLIQSNKRVADEVSCRGGLNLPYSPELIDTKGKRVVVIGGGDTGSDCVGTAHRQKAKTVLQIELLPKPPEFRTKDFPWPKYPALFKTSTSHEEGGERQWSVLTKKFTGAKGEVKKLSCVKVDTALKKIPGTEFEIEADLIILALGFLHPEKKGLIEELNLKLDSRGNVLTDANFMTSAKNVFSAGDMRRGQSLIAWAIYEGRQAACHINRYISL